MTARRPRDIYDSRAYELVARHHHDSGVAAFLLDAARRWGRVPRRGLELACGPGLTALDLAAAGVEMLAVDRSRPALAKARANARRLGLPLRTACADMAGFGPPAPVDLAYCLGPSTAHLPDSAALKGLLAVGRDALLPGGLFVVDFDFLPRLLHRTPLAERPPWWVMAGGPTQALRAPDGEGEVEVRFGVGPLLWDPRTWRFQAHNEIVWRRGERTRTVRYPSAGKVHHPLEVSALVDAVGGIEMLALLGSYELDHPLAVGDDRAVFVLRRRPEA